MQLRDIDVTLLEPDPIVRSRMRDALNAAGIHRILNVDSAIELERALGKACPDILICDGLDSGFAATKLTRTVRHGFLGENPFTVVVTTARAPTIDMVRQVIDGGTDCLVAKPFSGKDIVDRVALLVEHRKPFVVTKDYIGPDRRLGDRGDSDWPLIEAPNTLKDKAHGIYDPITAREQILKAKAVINEQKASRDAMLIASIVRQVMAAVEAGQLDERLVLHLEQLHETAIDIRRRLEQSHIGETAALCKSLVTVTEKIRGDPVPEMKDIRLLQNLAQAIHMAYEPDARMSKYAETIAATIKGAKRFQAA